MMSLKEYAVDVDKSIEEIISLCKKLNISSQTEDDMLTEDDIILLDISGVGTEKGYNKELLDKFDDLKEKLIIAGGLNKESLAELESLGIKKVLIGTSLHSGEVKILD